MKSLLWRSFVLALLLFIFNFVLSAITGIKWLIVYLGIDLEQMGHWLPVEPIRQLIGCSGESCFVIFGFFLILISILVYFMLALIITKLYDIVTKT